MYAAQHGSLFIQDWLYKSGPTLVLSSSTHSLTAYRVVCSTGKISHPSVTLYQKKSSSREAAIHSPPAATLTSSDPKLNTFTLPTVIYRATVLLPLQMEGICELWDQKLFSP